MPHAVHMGPFAAAWTGTGAEGVQQPVFGPLPPKKPHLEVQGPERCSGTRTKACQLSLLAYVRAIHTHSPTQKLAK